MADYIRPPTSAALVACCTSFKDAVGDWFFAVARPRLWNSLLASITAGFLAVFKNNQRHFLGLYMTDMFPFYTLLFCELCKAALKRLVTYATI